MLAVIKISKTIFCFVLLFFVIFTNFAPAGEPDISFYTPSQDIDAYKFAGGREVKNVIFMIGDGMGLGQVALARTKAAGLNGKLYMEKMPVSGLTRTHSANSTVTDSASAGTALATGFKTNNGAISQDGNTGEKFVTILEACRDKGMTTGLVATSRITHATPAAFGSHVASRNMEADIAVDLLENKINVLFGGGRDYFLPAPTGHRMDERNLITFARQRGYEYIENAFQLASLKGPHVLGLFQMGPLKTQPPEPTLAQLTKKAIEILDIKAKGFFLMVEGSQIDWACHGNDADETIIQTLLFDQAVKAAIDFAAADKRTLVIVTADHETGGLVITGGNMQGDTVGINWATKSHSALPVPIYSFGPGAEKFTGVFDNTEVAKKTAKLLRIKSFPAKVQ